MLKGLLASAGNTSNEPTDEYFNQVALLLKQQSVDAVDNQTFIDSSSTGHTITPSGTPTQGSFSPFQPNGWMAELDGASGGVSFTADAGQSLTGAFTVEAWVNFDNVALDGGIHPNILYWQGSSDQLYVHSTGYVGWYNGTDNILASSAGSIVAGTLYHVAVVRDGSNNFSLFINGERVATTTDSNTYGAGSGAVYVGSVSSTTGTIDGRIGSVRVVNGTAVYDPTLTTLTVPTTELTAIANTKLLVFQHNRFMDEGESSYALTAYSGAKVVAGGPFLSTVAYDPDTHGGSTYFDGSSYITLPDHADFAYGTGDVTIHGWVYYFGGETFFAHGTGTGSQASIHIEVFGGNWVFYLSGNGTTWNIASGISFGAAKANQWQHVALVRSSGVWKGYLNGVAGATLSDATALHNSTAVLSFGADDGGTQKITGNIAEGEVVVGTALWTTDFTPPTSPQTAVANTKLLLHFDNAGIYDATCKSNLIAHGNTETDTAVVKFDTASSLFAAGDGIEVLHPTLAEALRRGNWTIEAWFYPTTYVSQETIFSRGDVNSVGTDFLSLQKVVGVDKIGFFWRSSSPLLTSSATISTSTWTHVMVTKDGSDFEMFINGTSDVTNTNATELAAGSAPRLWYGTQSYLPTGSGRVWLGNLENIRISIGIVRETASFTAPIATYPIQGAN
jgi:hypothetical protein